MLKKGMKKCGKPSCRISTLADEVCTFRGSRTYFINFSFDCGSAGVVYLLSSKICCKIYVGKPPKKTF